ncbi:MAG TPA: tetratricopeptide repeat protein [Saprospiraceae bacterium]|nr:tetratricopeptide repeat protein [Saprospiraceae bacterium]
MENRSEHLLEAYFAHSLTEAEAAELTSLLQSDQDLAAEIRFRQQIVRAVQDKSLRAGIENPDWAKATIPPSGSGAGPAIKRQMWSRYMYAAAAVVVVLVFAWFFIPASSKADLIASQTASFPNKMTFKSLGKEALTVPPEVIQAFNLYDQQNYSAAAPAIEKIVSTYPDIVDYRFYWGVSLVHIQQYAQAINALEPVSLSQNDYQTVSLYYLGLAYAGNQETDKAKTTLQRYVNAPDGVTYRKQALHILNNL